MNKRICPLENAGGLDNSARRFLQNPRRIIVPYIGKGMTVLDLGCGPGFFTTEIAKIVQDSGRVLAADLQAGMLEKVRMKIAGTELESRITLHQCKENSIDLNEKVDFILAFYMIHEVPDQDKLFKELCAVLKPNGKLFIVEPKFHVSKKSFESMINRIKNIGFEIIDSPKVFFSHTVLVGLKAKQH